MNETLRNLLAQLRGLSAGSKAVAALVAAALALAVGVAGWVSSRPHFELLLGGLDDAESANVLGALSTAGIPFDVSSPPAPFVVYVDRGDRYAAFAAIYEEGALDDRGKGIVTGEGGMETVFLSGEERASLSRKRDWQEMELLLEELDFVEAAKVRTSTRSGSFLDRDASLTASVTLTLRGAHDLSREEAAAVAGLVRFGLGIEPEDLFVSDHTGRALYDGKERSRIDGSSDWLETKLSYDETLEEKANRLLAAILGSGKARVSVDSSWSFELRSEIAHLTDPAGQVVLSERRSSTKTPQGVAGGVGGPVGSASNLASAEGTFGVDDVGVETESGAAAAPPADLTAKTETTQREYVVPGTERVVTRTTPELLRLSISLAVDESLAQRAEELAGLVRGAVGFDAARNDVLTTLVIPMAPAEDGEPSGEEAAEPGALGPIVETLLDRGIEILAALVFVAFLLKSLKSARASAAAARSAEPEVDAEALARARVEELLETDPEKVASVLSRWASETRTGAGAA